MAQDRPRRSLATRLGDTVAVRQGVVVRGMRIVLFGSMALAAVAVGTVWFLAAG